MKDNDLNFKGFIAGLAVWLALSWSTSREMACLDSTCGPGDLMIFGVIGVAFLAPAWIAANIISGILAK